MWLALAACCFLVTSAVAGERLRVIVETDAGGDPDDEQSFVRFLLYSNEWDVEGVIANRAVAREGENKNIERSGLGILHRMIDAYERVYPNLQQHDDRYPSPALLRARTVAGYSDSSEGTELIRRALLDSADPRPVWFMNWGTDDGSAPSCLKRVLDDALAKGETHYRLVKNRVRLSSADKFGDHTFKIEPPFRFWVDTFRPPVDGKRWYHRFSEITARAGGFDLRRDVLTGHGPLGELYPTNTTHRQKEGDTMTFLYLVPTGMNDPAEPGWGSWAGRHGLIEGAERRPYYWANQADEWQGTTHRDNTLVRWAPDLQNDFRARMDWCVKQRTEANHRPNVTLNGRPDGEILRIDAPAGEPVRLTAARTTDPDGDALEYIWEVYPGSKENVQISVTGSTSATVRVPDRAPETHLLLTVRDDGDPPLAAYRRAIIRTH